MSLVVRASSVSALRSGASCVRDSGISWQLCRNGRLLVPVKGGSAHRSSSIVVHSEIERNDGGTHTNDEQPAQAAFPSELPQGSGSLLLQASPLSVLALAALVPGAEQVTAAFTPWAEVVRGFDLPDWLVHWGHPGNMAVVLFAMGGYGTWLGWQIRLSDDATLKAKAKDLHPKLLAGLFFFFAAGAVGGITSLVTTGRPIFESPHAVTGVIGLALLTIQTALPALFEGNPSLRGVHAWFGSSIMALFLVHFVFGLQLGLSY